MGSSLVRPVLRNWDEFPNSDFTPSVEPQYGFENGRKVRQPTATLEEMMAANIPKRRRDYCAHKLLEYEVCARRHFPDHRKCRNEKSNYNTCLRDDLIIRMKEMERERRFRLRQKKEQGLKEGTVAA